MSVRLSVWANFTSLSTESDRTSCAVPLCRGTLYSFALMIVFAYNAFTYIRNSFHETWIHLPSNELRPTLCDNLNCAWLRVNGQNCSNMSDSVRGTWRILCKVVPLHLIKLFNLHAFLGAFAKFRKAADSFVRSVCPSVCNNSALTGRIFMKFDIWVFFENSSFFLF